MNSSERERILNFSHAHVAEPWRAMVAAAGKVAKGESLLSDEARLRMPMTPFTIDARVMYPLMRDFVGLLTWEPNNLFTIILEDDGQTVFRAYLELTNDNNFVEMSDIAPNDPVLGSAVEFIRNNRIDELRWLLDEACQKKFKRRVNWVKIAKLSFFAEFAKAWEIWERTNDLWAWVMAALSATKKVYDEKLLMFSQEPPVFARLRELMSGILQIDPNHFDPKKLFGPLPRQTDKPVVLAIHGRDYVVALKMGGQDPLHMSVDRDATREVEGLPVKQIARRLYKSLNAKQVIVLRTEPLANLFYEAVRPKLPWPREETKLVLMRAMELIRDFGKIWHMHPLPFYLKNWFRVPGRILGLPYDINNLAAWFIPTVLIDGVEIFLGQHNYRTFVLLDGDIPVLALTVELYNAGLRGLRTLDPAQFADIFAGRKHDYDAMREGIREVGLRMWEKGYGFQNMASVIRLSALKALGDLLSVRRFSYLYKLLGLFGPLRRVLREMKAGGLVVYPDRLIKELENWVKSVGRVRIYHTLLNMNFDRKPRTRGLLYIKETIIAAIILSIIITVLVIAC